MEDPNGSTKFGTPARWRDLREMHYDVMSDLGCGWVQEYMPRSDASADVRVLSSPEQLAQSCSSTYCAYSDSRIEMFFVKLSVQAKTVEDITVGVSVDSYAGDRAPKFLVPRNDRFVHFVQNNYSGTLLSLSFDEEVGIVEMICYRQESPIKSLQLVVRFDSAVFMDAFDSNPGRPDFRKLEQGVLSIVVGDAAHDPRIPSLCRCGSINCSYCDPATRNICFKSRRIRGAVCLSYALEHGTAEDSLTSP